MSSSTNTTELQLRGLHGNNPLGFLAALGVLVALDHSGKEARMHWVDGVVPTPVLTTDASSDDIARAAISLNEALRESITKYFPGPPDSSNDDLALKLKGGQVREILRSARERGIGTRLWLSLLSEGAGQEDTSEWSKPTALSFTTGSEKVVSILKNILKSTKPCHIHAALENMANKNEIASTRTMRWNMNSNRPYALMAHDPASKKNGEKKMTNLGAESLAVLGLHCVPCFTDGGRARTQGVVKDQGKKTEYSRATFCWPLWKYPLPLQVVKTLLAQVAPKSHSHPKRIIPENLSSCYPCWGLFLVFESSIFYLKSRGSFRPSCEMWSDRPYPNLA